MKKGLTEIVFILDASGSMYPLTSDTIGGFNSLIDKQKEVESDTNITLVTFNDSVREVYSSKPLKEIENLTDKDYISSGMTALYDAIGVSIGNLDKKLSALPDEEKPEKVMIVITTDGYENSSEEYNHKSVKEILGKKEEEGWEIIFIGANIDVELEGGKIGLNTMKTSNYVATSEGTKAMYATVSEAVRGFREDGVLRDDWAKDLEEKG